MVWYITAATYIWGLLKLWLSTIFLTPFKNIDMLWLLVPIWLSWFFAEFFQEKEGTSMGNAISNAVVILWGAIDWMRQTARLISLSIITSWANITTRFLLALSIFVYGIVIIYLGVKGNKIVKNIGRIREVTYIFIMFTPIFYKAMPFSWNHMIATVLFFPLFYYTIELIDKYSPSPKSISELKNAEQEFRTRY